ncbi:unnamed protein product [Tuber aestivum]|uniref:Uncharacterized protein n=1 Tax=Tuber aestivum TaxID=59557 RepID=A0A292PT39_9PEZI|nr:unnamed protein product [Tuber aestivum]
MYCTGFPARSTVPNAASRGYKHWDVEIVQDIESSLLLYLEAKAFDQFGSGLAESGQLTTADSTARVKGLETNRTRPSRGSDVRLSYNCAAPTAYVALPEAAPSPLL